MGSALLDASNKRHWELIQQTEGGTAWLLKHFEDYASALAQNMRQTYLSPFTIVTPNIGERCGGGGRSRPWRRVCTQQSTGVPGDAAVCPPVCPGHPWGSWMLGDVGTCTPGDLSTVCAQGGTCVCAQNWGYCLCPRTRVCIHVCSGATHACVCRW